MELHKYVLKVAQRILLYQGPCHWYTSFCSGEDGVGAGDLHCPDESIYDQLFQVLGHHVILITLSDAQCLLPSIPGFGLERGFAGVS